ncbi:MAG: walR 1 [Acidobacteria bacterium]|nr:walR 1 [Acidobacteriota bacterium]
MTDLNAGNGAPKRRILIVEDEPAIRELVRFHLALAGFEVVELGDGAAALERGRAHRFDLIVLDIMLPGLDGITLCRALRTEGANRATPILMVTARDTESDTVLGLESGADDYLAKPFGVRELVARVSALFRRHERLDRGAVRDTHHLTRGELTVDADKRLAKLRGASIDLTKQEFDLLYLLSANPGIVFSRQALLARVWGGDTYVTERTVDTVVSRLRRKVETDPQDPELLLTAWGVGYKFVDEA